MAGHRTGRSEEGTLLKKWTNRVPVCVVFPNTYYVGMSNLAVHLLYSVINRFEEVVCERAFYEEGEPVLSVESGRELGSFELLFFTLSFEMDYVNIPRILKAAGCGALAAERGETSPLVIGGGMCVMANPEPVSPFFDLFILGDVEATVPEFISRYLSVREKKREDLVKALTFHPWVYDPSRLAVEYGEDGRVSALLPAGFSVATERYKGKELARSIVTTEDTEFSRMKLLEGARGCPSACPFCLTGSLGPCTFDPLTDVGEAVSDVGIIGGGISFHPHLAEIVGRLKGQGVRVHLPSLRVDEVPLEVIELIKDDVKTLTFGIEAGTEKLRSFIGKPLTNKEVFEKIEAVSTIKAFHLKLYFMIGLAGETRADVEAIIDLAKHLMHLMIKAGSARGQVGSITVHASPFVPKASTPFQWLAMEERDPLKDKIALLARGLKKADNTYFTHESVKYSFLQAVFARGDRRVSSTILDLAEGTSLTRILRESPLNLPFYVNRERGKDELFPWDFMTESGHKERLYRKLTASLAGIGSSLE